VVWISEIGGFAQYNNASNMDGGRGSIGSVLQIVTVVHLCRSGSTTVDLESGIGGFAQYNNATQNGGG
jgi:hypothetical protein